MRLVGQIVVGLFALLALWVLVAAALIVLGVIAAAIVSLVDLGWEWIR